MRARGREGVGHIFWVPPLKIFQERRRGLLDSFWRYRFLVREIKITIIRYTMSGGMAPLKKDPSNSWSYLKNYNIMYKIVYSSDTRDLSKNIFLFLNILRQGSHFPNR